LSERRAATCSSLKCGANTCNTEGTDSGGSLALADTGSGDAETGTGSASTSGGGATALARAASAPEGSVLGTKLTPAVPVLAAAAVFMTPGGTGGSCDP